MKTSKSVLVIGVAGCLSSVLCSTALIPTAAAADTTLSLLQPSSTDVAVIKAQSSGTAPIVTSPSALVLSAQKGQTAVGTLSLRKSSTDQHSYYLSTNQGWVWMNPPYGSTQTITTETDQLVITAQTADLPAGTHSAVVYIVDSGPNNFTNMLRIPVTLTVTAAAVAPPPPPPATVPPAVTPPTNPVAVPPPPAPAPVVPPVVTGTAITSTPAALVLSAAKGQTAVGTLSLHKGGTDQHSYYLSTNQGWVWMNPPYGSTQTITTETDQLVITAQTADLPAGTHSAVVYIVQSGPNNFQNMLRIPVTLTVTAAAVAPPPPPPATVPPAVTPPTNPVAVPPPPAPAPVVPPVVTGTAITSTPAALVLSAAKGQTAVGTLSLHKGGTDQHSYYLSTNQGWVWMNPPYGSTQTITTETDQLVITAQTSGLSAGTYSAVVYIVQSGPNNFQNMLRVPVTLTVTAAATTPPPPPAAVPSAVTPTPVVVTPPPPPTPVVVPPPPAPAPPAPAPAPVTVATGPIQVTPAALSLTSANNVGTLTLKKTGTDQHAYYLSTNQGWIWMNPPYGSTQTITTETDQLVITAQTAGLAAGTYSGVVYIVESGPNNFANTLRIPVTFTVAAGQAASSTPTTPTQPTVTSPPPPPPSPPAPTAVPPTPTSSASSSTAPKTASATVSWNANTESDLAGYRVYVGTRSGSYGVVGPFEVTNGTSFTVPNLPLGTTYFFAVSAFDKSGNESAKSAEVSKSLF